MDTGGVVSLIRDDLAKRLGLKKRSSANLGIGGVNRSYPIYEGRDFIIGGSLRDKDVALAGTDRVSFGEDVSGSLAAGAMTAFDSELDFGKGEWRIYRDGIKDRTGYVRLASEIRHHNLVNGSAYIFADVVLDGKPYRFLLDTGAPVAARLYGPASRKSGLWDDTKPWVPLASRGDHESRLVRAGSLQIGDTRFDAPLVVVESGPAGRYEIADGYIGLTLLRRLNLSSDVKTGVMWVQPNRLPPVPDRYAMSGIWIDRKGNGIVVGQVGRGSPAEQAGVRVGDEILGEQFGALIGKLDGRQGGAAPVPLSLRRGGEVLQVTVRPAPYL
jgi:serine protease Do